jgi:hypothetical protein
MAYGGYGQTGSVSIILAFPLFAVLLDESMVAWTTRDESLDFAFGTGGAFRAVYCIDRM